jgi:hypothetical protein
MRHLSVLAGVGRLSKDGKAVSRQRWVEKMAAASFLELINMDGRKEAACFV